MPTINKKYTSYKPNIETKSKKSDNNDIKTPFDYNYYHTSTWYRLRQYILHQQLFCQDCIKKGRYVQPTDVHHIIPFMSGKTEIERYKLFSDPNNLVALCEHCHQLRHNKKYHKNKKFITY